jgi:hypothetical protein
MAEKPVARRGRERHDMSYTRTYRQWKAMIQRCENPKHDSYPYYGGKGISVCPEWRNSFTVFYAEMGECPPDMFIEREDNDKNYFKGNCHWATRLEEARHTTRNNNLSYSGKTQPRTAWAEEVGLPPDTIRWRQNDGWTDAQALGFEPPPPDTRGPRAATVTRFWDGRERTLRELSEIGGKSPGTLFAEHSRGWTTERMMARQVGPDEGDIYTVNGKTQNAAAHCAELGLNRTTVSWRLRNGWSPERAFSTDDGRQGENNRKRRRTLTSNGLTLTEKEWCDKLGLSYASFLQRCSRGMDRKKAMGLE